MQMIRQYAVPHNQRVEVTVPEEFIGKSVEIQVILVETNEPADVIEPPKKGGPGHLVGSLSHLTPEQNEKIDRELNELRDSWERPIFQIRTPSAKHFVDFFRQRGLLLWFR